MIKQYMVKIYSFLIKAGKREIEGIPESYQIPVAEHLAHQEENQ
ncbi:CD1375 family protein [Maledivibacter halophilus]|uniref:Uncharacterized protein n=1 Tax=Maledivibacter halophilus TaxID=36842 RepID=A0A1T5L7K8_9FIRM|nr:CD1375 family protein [Maledivibacter halophilus]SKC67965.1 hypothetical protein SAMN02194393_02117 [Maledivibacter halophilus]SKC71920.1 hypothetical protein SAMN02194393_02535 [Maledivibacter halophilus]SKC80084.1 hypothetical protein SAMN02194393_03428 [Maledivibacter halophilus]